MTNKNNEEGIKALAEALRAGGTLLNAACPICDSPLIKIEDKIFCKICDKEVLVYRDEKELPKEIQRSLKIGKKEETPIERTLKMKLESLRMKLENTDDPDEIIKLSEAIDKILVTLDRIIEND